MKYCIRVAKFRDRWQVIVPEKGEDDIDTVQLVTDAPEFLGLLTPVGPVPRAAIVAPNSTSGRVVLAVNDSGRIRLVACPQKGDDAELGALMADLLSTSGRLWHQPYAAVAEPFEKYLGVPLANWVGDRAGKGWTREGFKSGVEKSLQEGQFPVTILAKKVEKPLQELLGYLKNMNLEVTVLGYSHVRGNGVEMVTPEALGRPQTAPQGPPAQRAAPESQTEGQGRPIPGQVMHGEQHTQTVAFSSKRPTTPPGPHEPFPVDGASPEQQRILKILVQLDEVGLSRRGLEYFVPGFEQREEAEGAVVIAVDGNRWPFPKPEEVVVVVNTGPDYLAGYLKLSSEEIEEFLGSLPRVQRKEHRGAMLLKASNITEAEQLVNELRALREVAQSGV